MILYVIIAIASLEIMIPIVCVGSMLIRERKVGKHD
jgi:hypothetical protein